MQPLIAVVIAMAILMSSSSPFTKKEKQLPAIKKHLNIPVAPLQKDSASGKQNAIPMNGLVAPVKTDAGVMHRI